MPLFHCRYLPDIPLSRQGYAYRLNPNLLGFSEPGVSVYIAYPRCRYIWYKMQCKQWHGIMIPRVVWAGITGRQERSRNKRAEMWPVWRIVAREGRERSKRELGGGAAKRRRPGSWGNNESKRITRKESLPLVALQDFWSFHKEYPSTHQQECDPSGEILRDVREHRKELGAGAEGDKELGQEVGGAYRW